MLIRDNKVANKLEDPKWIFNETYKIFHPIQVLDLPDSPKEDTVKSPLILKKIILGPKCNEANVNNLQLRALLNQLGLNIAVEESAISFYR